MSLNVRFINVYEILFTKIYISTEESENRSVARSTNIYLIHEKF